MSENDKIQDEIDRLKAKLQAPPELEPEKPIPEIEESPETKQIPKSEPVTAPKQYEKLKCPHKDCPVYLNIRDPDRDYQSIIDRHIRKKHS